ncbi:helix-turn-helix domain-containing protein [Bacillus testis]|uniref:helix-turn-helix domain-containing protein n=1 Tax=Bacillus testis TaxID=1622072 RepID=UPI00067EE0C2|nr:tetratricopeptide repeat protein [Bacillus testis]
MESFGRLVYFHRKKQHKTQETLCRGICSITHLSKIENGSKEGSMETLSLLFERLGVELETEKSTIEEIKHLLQQFLESVLNMHEEKATHLFQQLHGREDFIACTNLAYIYELYKLRYYLLMDQAALASVCIQNLEKSKRKFSQHETYLFQYFFALYLIKERKFTAALSIFKELQTTEHPAYLEASDFFYYKSLIYSHLHHSALAIHYANVALKRFELDNNFFRMIDAQLLIAIQLTVNGQYGEAEMLFDRLLNSSQLSKNGKRTAMILHNRGFLHNCQNDCEKAIEYYKASIRYSANSQNEWYIATLLNMANIYIFTNEHQKAVEVLERVERNIEMKGANYIRFKISHYLIFRKMNKLKRFLDETAIPFLDENQHVFLLSEYQKKLTNDHHAVQEKIIY